MFEYFNRTEYLIYVSCVVAVLILYGYGNSEKYKF